MVGDSKDFIVTKAPAGPLRGPGHYVVRFGLICASILMSMDLLFYFFFSSPTNADGRGGSEAFSASLGWTSLAILIVTVLLSVVMRARDEHRSGGKFTLSSALSTGIPTALFVGLLYGVFRYVFFRWIAPEIAIADMESIRVLLDKQGIVGEDAAQNMLWNRRFKYGIVSIGAIMFLYSFIGFTVSVISGLLLWRRKSLPPNS